MTKISFLYCVLIIFILYVVSVFSFVQEHEAAHRAIYDQYDIESETQYSLIKAFTDNTPAWTIADKEEYDLKCNENCKTLHTQNEIVGYNLASIQITLWLILLSYIVYKEYSFSEKLNLYELVA